MYRFDEFELDLGQRLLLRDGQPVSISPKAFEVLTGLIRQPGEVITKEYLLQTVWPGAFVEEDNLVQHISSLRKIFAAHPRYIVTLPGRGYQFAAPVQRIDAEPPAPTPADRLVQRERMQVVIEESVEVFPPHPKMLPGTAHRISSKWVAWGITGIVLLAVAGDFAWQRFGPKPQLRKVEVADFLNLTGDSSFDHPLRSALIIGLSQTPYIQVMSDGLAHATLTQMQKSTDTPLLGETAIEVCARGNYQALLRGKIETASKYGYDLSLEAVNCSSGKTLDVFKGHAIDRDKIVDALDDMVRRSRIKLGEPNASLDEFDVSLPDATTFSFEALKDYSTGLELGNAGKLKECIVYFQKAVDIDPKFADALAGLGTAYYNLGSREVAGDYYKKAFELSGNVSENQKFYIRSNYYLMALLDLPAAVKNLREWANVYPDNVTTWLALCNAEIQIGDFGSAIQAGEHALKMRTDHTAFSYWILALAYKRGNRFADAKRTVAEAEAQGKDTPTMHGLLYSIAMIEHDPETLQRLADYARGKPEEYDMLESEAMEAADGGQYGRFEELIERAEVLSAKEVDAGYADSMLKDEASAETQLGRTTKAAELLRRAKDKTDCVYAVAALRAGDSAPAETCLRPKEANPKDTIEHFLVLPELRALMALRNNDPVTAIAALEPSRPFEFARCEVIEVRAQAYLAAGQPDKAALEFQKLLEHPALEDPTLPRTILAHVGLAQSFARLNRVAESRHEYETFFGLWTNAPANFPILKQAHLEYSLLTQEP